jgi:hypothetical protein
MGKDGSSGPEKDKVLSGGKEALTYLFLILYLIENTKKKKKKEISSLQDVNMGCLHST